MYGPIIAGLIALLVLLAAARMRRVPEAKFTLPEHLRPEPMPANGMFFPEAISNRKKRRAARAYMAQTGETPPPRGLRAKKAR